MIKASIGLQELRRKIYRKAKTEKQWRFWGLYCHVCKKEVLREAYRLAKANDGAPGIDGKSFEDIEAEGVEGFLEGIGQELLNPSSTSKNRISCNIWWLQFLPFIFRHYIFEFSWMILYIFCLKVYV